MRWSRSKSPRLVVWNETKALPLAWFSGLAILLNLLETTAVWPQGCVLCVCCRCFTGCGPLVEGWVPESVFSVGNGVSSVEAWYSTALDIEEVLFGACDGQLHVMFADVF